MNSPIRNLQDLDARKALLRSRMRAVEEEMRSSALRTRAALSAYVEQKMEIPNQVSRFLQDDVQQSVGVTLLRFLLQAAGVQQRWSKVALLLAPIAFSYARKRWEQIRQKKRGAAPGGAAVSEEALTLPH